MACQRFLRSRWTKIPVFGLSLVPVLLLGLKALNGELGANPIEFVTHWTGDWTIRLLCMTLGITPLRKLVGLPELIRVRRMLGLFCFFYACLHFMTWFMLDKFFDWNEIAKDVVKRPFITAGFIAFALLIPLAITSTSGWIRRLGGKRWQLLHRLVYVSAGAGAVHYYWLVKSDVRLPLLYGAIVAVLLAYRAFPNRRNGHRLTSPAAVPGQPRRPAA